jgi:hypothetical protein
MNKIVISKLISVANELDAMGDSVNADRLTNLADSYQAPRKEDIDERMDQSFEDSDDFSALQNILSDMLSSGEITSDQKNEIEDIVNGEMSTDDFSSDDDSMNVKELSNPIDGDEMMADEMPDEMPVEMEDTDIEKPNDEDLESLFADDPELLEWWRNLGNRNE